MKKLPIMPYTKCADIKKRAVVNPIINVNSGSYKSKKLFLYWVYE